MEPQACREEKARSLPVLVPQRARPGWQRAVEVGLRSVHVVSMGLVLGGIPFGGTRETLLVPIVLTVASGLLLLATSVTWGCLSLGQGAGWAFLLKMALLGLGNLVEPARLPLYLLAVMVSSTGSHMPSSWRHFTLRQARAALGADGI